MKIQLRPLHITASQRDGEEFFDFHDRDEIAPDVSLPQEFAPILALCDGTRDSEQLLAALQSAGHEIDAPWLDGFLAQLDEIYLLDSPNFKAHVDMLQADFATQTTRPATLAGHSYPRNPAHLREFLAKKLALGTARLPAPNYDAAKIRGIVTPHIDFGRGGHVEAASYAPLLENVRATGRAFDTLVVLGIAHSGVRYPFCASTQNFDTPFGVAECDRAFVEELEAFVGPQLTRETRAHDKEHSIEFCAVFCQFFDELKTSKIVPILCGGFWEALESGKSPENAQPEVAQFIDALREVTEKFEAAGHKIGFIASVDGAHVGTQFGDETPLTPAKLAEIAREDETWIGHLETGDKSAFHAHFARDSNRFSVDAHPALYTLLAAFPDLRAQKLDYDQAFHPDQNIVVSFASLALIES